MDHLVVEAVGLTKVFKDFWGRPKAVAVNGIDFSIRPGEVVGFLGPNGSGKSTTVKLILDLLTPSSGSLRIFDRSPNNIAIKRRIGYLPEETYLYRYLTAEETLDFFGSLFDLPAAERRRRIDQLLDMVGLTHAAQRPVGEFSKGMARRIGLAQALVNAPELVILDEPTSGLDPLGCRDVKDLILTLKNQGKTVILCSHLLADVEDICDHVLIMYGGKIRAQGSLNELLTIEQSTQITTSALSSDVLERVLRILNEHANGSNTTVDHPSMSLEALFMDVVNRAREESAETHGAQAGGTIAGYLTEERPSSGTDVLAALAKNDSDTPEPSPEKPDPVSLPNEDRLASLAAKSTMSADASTAEDVEPQGDGAADNSEKNARLAQLLARRQSKPDNSDND